VVAQPKHVPSDAHTDLGELHVSRSFVQHRSSAASCVSSPSHASARAGGEHIPQPGPYLSMELLAGAQHPFAAVCLRSREALGRSRHQHAQAREHAISRLVMSQHVVQLVEHEDGFVV
jgi:hypothetical protein